MRDAVMRWWRVTRYDPAQRDEHGHYIGTTWTDISDVGEEFDGHQLTMEEYLRTEDDYIRAMTLLACECEEERLAVRCLSLGDHVSAGDVLSVPQAAAAVRDLLRGKADFVLESPDRSFRVHVGYDLYMYLGFSCSGERTRQQLIDSVVFVEDIAESPMYRDAL